MRRYRVRGLALCLLVIAGCTLSTDNRPSTPPQVTATLAAALPTASPEPPPSATPEPTPAPTDTPTRTPSSTPADPPTATMTPPPTLTPVPSAIPPTRTVPGPTAAPPLDDGSGGIVPGTGSTAAAFSPVPGIGQLPATLYYLSDAGAVAQVWRLRAGLNHPDQLTFSPTGVTAFDVAPDGTVAYLNPQGQLIAGGIPVLPPLDTTDALPRITALAWAPDGAWLAFIAATRGASDAMSGAHPIDGVWIRGQQGIAQRVAASVYATGGAWQVFTSPLDWRPDGRELLAGTEGAGETHVTRIDVATGRTQVILPDDLTTDPAFSASWSAGGAIIASGAGRIVRIDPDTLTTQTLLGPESGLAPLDVQALASGTVSFVGQDSGGTRLYLLPGAGVPGAITGPLPEGTAFDMLWDDAQQQILIAVYPTGGPLGTAYWRDAGGALHDLTALTGAVGAPRWGPLFKPLDAARVQTTEGDTLNLRAVPGGQVIVQLVSGSRVIVQEGPRAADGYRWWRVQTPNGVSGWVVESVSEDGELLRTLLPTD